MSQLGTNGALAAQRRHQWSRVEHRGRAKLEKEAAWLERVQGVNEHITKREEKEERKNFFSTLMSETTLGNTFGNPSLHVIVLFLLRYFSCP